MDPDPYAAGIKDHTYRVTSLYFDSDTLDHYNEKLDGNKTRKKYRIRTYAREPQPGLEVFLEIKRRKNSVVIKDRVNVPYEAVKAITFDSLFELIKKDSIPRGLAVTLQEFIFDLYRLRMTPKVLVSYVRKPLIAKINKRIRVTFDSSIRSVSTDHLFCSEPGRFLFPNEVVMEIKFSGSMPWWLHHVIQKYGVRYEAISKYCLGVDSCESEWSRYKPLSGLQGLCPRIFDMRSQQVVNRLASTAA